MSLAHHLLELRRRLVVSAWTALAASVIGWFLADPALQAIRAPIMEIALTQHRLAALNFDNLTGAFDLKLQIALTIGLIISSPVWLFQLFAFLVPGLSTTERRYTFGFFFTAVPLFLGGCAAGWYVVPHIIAVLSGFAPAGAASLIQANDYFTFIIKLVVAVGMGFVLPVLLVLLNFVGVLSAHSLRKSWRIAILSIMIFSAAVTPSADIMSMFFLAAPLVILCVMAWGVAGLHDRRHARILIAREASLLEATAQERTIGQ